MSTLILWQQVLQNFKKAISFKKNNTEELEWDDKIIQQCKILYRQNSKPMSETCMCWGLACGAGWKEPLRKLSFKLEALNLEYYPKYNIRIQANQVKEKFGTLRFYHSVVVEPCKIIGMIISFFNIFINLLKKVKYNVSYVNAKYVPAKHKFLYKIKNYLQTFTSILNSLPINYSSRQRLMAYVLDDITHELIRITENECEDVCEECGNNIGENGYHTKCATVGWVKYICEICAEKSGRRYIMNGAAYEGKTCIKTKEQETLEMKAD